MNAPKLGAALEEISNSLWFIPALSVLASLLLAAVLTRVQVSADSFLGGIVFGGGVDGARGMLQAVAGSVITVTSLTFSLTVVTLQLASSQFSPRLLRTFLRDRGNQVVLAVFLSTFAYSLTVLRTIRAGDDTAPEFVPQLAVSVAFLLALASVAALVYFIDHITTEIRVDTMMSDVEADTLGTIDRIHPAEPEHDQTGPPPASRPPVGAVAVPALRSGFLATVSPQPLVVLGAEHDLVFEFDPRVGDSVIQGGPLVWCWPADASGTRPDAADLVDAVNAAASVAFERTLQEDVGYGLRQLVDIAVKALSPGVNDPTTAVHSLGRLSSPLRRLAERPVEPLVGRDDDGTVRVVVRRREFDALLSGVCGEIRRYGCAEPTVMTSLLQLLRDVGDGACDQRRREAVRTEIELVTRAAGRSVDEPADLAEVTAAADTARRAVAGDRRPGPR